MASAAYHFTNSIEYLMPIWMLLPAALIVLALGLALLVRGRRQAAATGLPAGQVVYDDSGAWEAVEQPLLSRRYGLVGRPDYLVRLRVGRAEQIIPVEVKSRRRPRTPTANHIMQLATYCLLIEDTHKTRPDYGLLRYADATLKIPYTDDLRRAVLETADAIRRGRHVRDLDRDHNDKARCFGCGYRNACGQAVE